MRNLFGFIFLSFVLMSGCSSNVRMSGTVSFSDNGEPLETGFVVFDDGTIQARGKIKSGGKYVLGLLKENDGVPKGKYRVYIFDANQYEDTNIINTEAMTEGGGGQKVYLKKAVPLIDSKLMNAETSGWTCHVDGSSKTYNITVDRPKR
jgi:hypothetical protein